MIWESLYGFPAAVSHLPQTSLAALCSMAELLSPVCVFLATGSDRIGRVAYTLCPVPDMVSDLSDLCFSGRDGTEDTRNMEGDSSSADVGAVSGAWDRASATARLFPGTWLIENEYCIIRRRNRCTRSGSSSRFFSGLNRGTSGLWSVSLWNWRPSM